MPYSLPRIDHIHITDCFVISPQTGGGYLPCSLSDWALFCAAQGEADILISAQSVHVHMSDFLLLSPNSCHSIAISPDSRLLCFCFNGLAAALPAAFFHLTAADTVAAFPILSLLDTAGLDHQARDRVLEALLLQLISMPAFQITAPPASSLPLQILRYLNDNFHDDLSLQALADTFHISVSHIIHIFNPLFGLSPIQYLIRRRIGEAQLLMRRTDQNAGDIAAQVGIINRNYFYRTFKRLTGLSPSQYRSAVCGSPPNR